jgi:TonB family protein
MPDIWKHWAGQTVDGKFPLRTYLGGSEYSAVFLTERPTGQGPREAAVKLIPAPAEGGERQLARWRLAARLSHPHLLPLYEMGRSELGGVPVLYLVMEYADENLAQVLALRALTGAEARAMLEPVLGVLAYLHGNELVHGHVKPTNLMANGDRLMMSSDAVRRAGEPCDAPGRPDAYDAPETARGVIPRAAGMAPAGDVWSLGVTLVEALTQKLPRLQAGSGGDPALPAGMPEPLQEIARLSVLRYPQSRWSVAQIAMRLEGRVPARADAAAAPAQTKQVPARTSAGAAARVPAGTSRPAVARPKTPRSKRFLYALPVLAGLVVAAALTVPKLLRQEKPQSAQGNVAAAQSHVPAASPLSQQPAVAAAATPAPGRTIAGQVARQVLPKIPQDASNTISGTVVVTVRVDVDAAGKVTHAEIAFPGPSKYFARKSMEAAPQWTFAPPRVNGRRVPSQWLIRFGYTTGGPQASAEPAAP